MLGREDSGGWIKPRGMTGGEGTETGSHQCGEGSEDDNLDFAFED